MLSNFRRFRGPARGVAKIRGNQHVGHTACRARTYVFFVRSRSSLALAVIERAWKPYLFVCLPWESSGWADDNNAAKRQIMDPEACRTPSRTCGAVHFHLSAPQRLERMSKGGLSCKLAPFPTNGQTCPARVQTPSTRALRVAPAARETLVGRLNIVCGILLRNDIGSCPRPSIIESGAVGHMPKPVTKRPTHAQKGQALLEQPNDSRIAV